MPIDTITDLSAFEQLRDNWNTVYKADTTANLFLSWDWLHDNFLRHPNRYFTIYAWYPEGPSGSIEHRYSAFLPMCKRISLNKQSRRFEPIIGMAGSYWADYTSPLCMPIFEAPALRAFSTHLANQALFQIRFDGLATTGTRKKYLLDAFSSAEFKVRYQNQTDNSGQVKLSICPQIKLPKEPDEWFASLSRNTRLKIRRFQRLICKSDEMNIRYTTTHTLEADLAAFKTLWMTQWKSKKGKKTSAKADYYAALIRDGIATGHLYMRVLMFNKKVVGTVACYQDAIHKRELFLVSSRDKRFHKLPGGLLLHSQNIIDAIHNNYTSYDFLRGDEEYKFTLGATTARINNIRITPRHVAVEAKFIPIQLKEKALKTLLREQSGGKASSIEKIYSQMLESFPGDIDVLAAYRDWLFAQGEPLSVGSEC